MRSISEFFLLAVVVTMTPRPATALVLRVAARDGRRAAMGAVVGNSTVPRPRMRRAMERVTGGVPLALGISLAAEAAR